MTHLEEEGYDEAKVTHVTGEASVGEKKYFQEAADDGKTEVDKVVGKVIKWKKSYDIEFQLGVIIS